MGRAHAASCATASGTVRICRTTNRAMRYAARVSVAINQEHIARDVIVIGASVGGVRAVIELLSRLPADLPAFIGVVIHRSPGSTADWSEVLGMKTSLRVVEPNDGDTLT